MQREFYEDLFTKKKTIPIENSYFTDMLDNLPSLSDELKKKFRQFFYS